jgi:N-methylhydantoinase B
MRRALRLTRGTATYSLLADGAVVPPFGILGGESGATVGSFRHEAAGDYPFPTPGKVGGHKIGVGEAIVLQSAGGGGYGDPLDRSVEAVLADLADGYVSAAQAREVYGVLPGDAEGTVRRREVLRQARVYLAVVTDSEDGYEAIGRGRKRIARLNPADAARLGLAEDGMLEILTSAGAPLRAWLRRDATVDKGSLPLDDRGVAILRIGPGAEVRVRPVYRPQLR